MSNKKIFLIIGGMHRAGTSFLARALNLHGVYLGSLESLMSHDWYFFDDNLRGHWEHNKLAQLANKTFEDNNGTWDNIPEKIIVSDDIGQQITECIKELTSTPFPGGFKDPRILILLDSWKRYLPKNIAIVGIFRHPLKVAESLKIRNGFSYEKSLNLWKIYNEKLLDHLEKYGGFLLDFDWPKEKLISEIDLISEKLGLQKDVDLSDWYTEELFHSDKTYQKDVPLDEESESLYFRLKKKSQSNVDVKIEGASHTLSQFSDMVQALFKEILARDKYFKILNDRNLETIKKKDLDVDPLIQMIKQKDSDLETLDRLVRQKDSDLDELSLIIGAKEHEILNLRDELFEIRKSVLFNLVRKITKKIDSAFPNGTRLGELKKIVVASILTITNEGYRNFFSAVKAKIQGGEYKVLSPISLSEDEEISLTKTVSQNFQSRLDVKPHDEVEIEKDQIVILHDTEQSKMLDRLEIESDQIVICTIISKNYLAYARVLTDSFLKYNPNGKVFVLLVDIIDSQFDPTKEKFSLINIRDIGVDDVESFCFKYNILEQNTGVKAHFLKYLLEKYKLKKLAYFDPDILFTGSIENLWQILDNKSIILTPHITSPISDNKKPSEFDIMRSGSFNLGFIALSNNETTQKFLNWWIPHLMQHGYSDVTKGMFVDQRWIDLVPSLFDDVYILKHPGYNAAYWNLMERNIEIKNGKVYANNKPLYFFHFSGFMPENIENISKHQNRFTLKDVEQVRPLFELYRDLLVENDYLAIKKWKCKFNYFDNGVRIPDQARKVYAEAIQEGLHFGNPFSASQKDSFFSYLNGEVDNKEPTITRFWYQIYKERNDLHEAFPDPLGKDRLDYIKWLRSLEREYSFDEVFLPSTVLEKQPVLTNKNVQFEIRPFLGIESKRKELAKLPPSDVGINVMGYFQGKFGVAESARNFVWAIKNAGIPYVLNNVTAVAHESRDKTFRKFETKNPYPINLVVINSDETKSIYHKFGPNYFNNKYNIGVWAWELSEFPETLVSNLRYYDEIWVLSNFVASAISKRSPIPVFKMTCPIELDETKLVPNREKFKIKDKAFVFLFIFDFLSIYERKNPMPLVNVFKKTFGDDENVVLVIKSINGSKFLSEKNKMLTACLAKNIRFIDEPMNKEDLSSLMATADCYVSLHRSEGLGLTLAEAMYAKKPVIATCYGGNTDFMNEDNSFPVKYKIIELEKNYGPYKKGNVWAEPDYDHASYLMRFVYENQERAKKIGENASTYIREHMNYKVAGEEILTRIRELQNLSTNS